MHKVKFAIIGCGSIGVKHAAVINSNKRAQITALCDIDAKKQEQLSALYGGVQGYPDFKKLIHDTDADVVNICTPHNLHAQMSIFAARAGKHVLIEKPMALSVADCSNIIKAGEENKVAIMVVKQNRFNIPIALVRGALDNKKLGRIFMVSCNVFWNRNEDYYSSSNWRGRKESEGGALYTQVSHFIDILVWWFGDIAEAITKLETKNHSIEIEDCGNSIITFDDGVMGTISWTTCAHSKNYEGSITIIGEHGTIKIGGSYLNKIEHWDVLSYPMPANTDFDGKQNNYGSYQGTSSNHDKVIENVIAKLLGERHDIVAGAEGARTIKAIEKIYNSQYS